MKRIATCDGVRIERGAENGEPFVRVTFGHWSAACIFLMFWLAFWSFGCYMLVVDIFTKPFSFKLVLAALMLFGPEIFVASMILLMIFGRTVFTFRREGGSSDTPVPPQSAWR